MNDGLIATMRGRVEQCRRLARSINDPEAASVLRKMADEGEADIKRLLDEEAARADRHGASSKVA